MTTLQYKSIKHIKSLNAASTMDLIAIITKDGSINVFRTLSWERVIYKSPEEISSDKIAEILLFSCNGSVLVVGGTCGLLLTVNVETGTIINTVKVRESALDGDICALRWCYFDNFHENSKSILLFNPGATETVNQALHNGLPEMSSEISFEDDVCDELSARAGQFYDCIFPMTKSTSGSKFNSLLLVQSSAGYLSGYIYGLFPLFSITILPNFTLSNGCHLSEALFLRTNMEDSAYVGAGFTRVKMDNISRQYSWYAHAASLLLSLKNDIARVNDLISTLGRKWKDATRVLSAKLVLFQSLLDNYELPYTPVQFMYSIVLCGMWHPAASASFANHWNDQGMVRLKSAIDSVSKSVLKCLISQVSPIATNMALVCRELHGMQHALFGVDNENLVPEGISKKFNDLIRCSEQMLFKIDDTISEARLARENLLLYLQFVRECALPDNAPDHLLASSTVEFSSKPKLLKMFDPRISRAAENGKFAQGESVCATHLYALLQDSTIPEYVVSRQKSEIMKTASLGSPVKNGEIGSHTDKIANTNKPVCLQNIFCDADTSSYKSTVLEENFEQRSLISQIRLFNECIDLTFIEPHSAVSNKVCSTEIFSLPQLTPVDRGGPDSVISKQASHIDFLSVYPRQLIENYAMTHHLNFRCVNNSTISNVTLPFSVDGASSTQESKFCINEGFLSIVVMSRSNGYSGIDNLGSEIILLGYRRIEGGLQWFVGKYILPLKTKCPSHICLFNDSMMECLSIVCVGASNPVVSAGNVEQDLYLIPIENFCFSLIEGGNLLESIQPLHFSGALLSVENDVEKMTLAMNNIRKRSLPHKDAVTLFEVCTARGVVCLSDKNGTVLILDMRDFDDDDIDNSDVVDDNDDEEDSNDK